MATNVQLNLSAAAVPAGTRVDLNGLIQLVARSLNASLSGSFLTGQIGGAEPTQNIGLWIKDGTSIWTWDSGTQKYVQASVPLIRDDMTLLVVNDGSQDGVNSFATVQAAHDYLLGYQFLPGVTATLRVKKGTYTSAAPIVFNHPQGRQITVLGDPLVQTDVTSNATLTAGTLPFYTLTFSVASTVGLAVGDLVMLLNDANVTLDGAWTISAISGQSVSLQWMCWKAGQTIGVPGRLLNLASVASFPTKFVYTGTALPALIANPNGLGALTSLSVLSNPRSNVTTGIQIEAPNTVTLTGVAVSGFNSGITVDGSGANLSFFGNNASCGHQSMGLGVFNAAIATIGAGQLCTGGNTLRGVWANGNSVLNSSANMTLVSGGNGEAALLSGASSSVNIGSSTVGITPTVYASSNGLGLFASGSGTILFEGASVHAISANTSRDFQATVGGRIFVSHAGVTVHTFTPANNTATTDGSFIQVGV